MQMQDTNSPTIQSGSSEQEGVIRGSGKEVRIVLAFYLAGLILGALLTPFFIDGAKEARDLTTDLFWQSGENYYSLSSMWRLIFLHNLRFFGIVLAAGVIWRWLPPVLVALASSKLASYCLMVYLNPDLRLSSFLGWIAPHAIIEETAFFVASVASIRISRLKGGTRLWGRLKALCRNWWLLLAISALIGIAARFEARNFHGENVAPLPGLIP